MDRTIYLFFWLRRAALAGCFLVALFGAAAGAVGGEKAGYEKALEQKAEAALVSLLGPGKAGVMVRVAMESRAGAQESNAAAEGASVPAGIQRLTVFLALSDSVTDADAQKARVAISELLNIVPGRGDEVLVMKTVFAAGRDEPGRSGGLGKYASRGLWLLAGIFIAVIFSPLLRPAANIKGVAAARAPMQPSQYVPPPIQPQSSPAENEELNIRNRSGFYK